MMKIKRRKKNFHAKNSIQQLTNRKKNVKISDGRLIDDDNYDIFFFLNRKQICLKNYYFIYHY